MHLGTEQTLISIKIVTNDEIKSLNKEFRKKNKVTDVLSFPDDHASGDIAIADSYILDKNNTINAQNFSTHQVKKGETVTGIAREYGVTTSDIYALNPDAKKELKPNTILIIPISKAKKTEATNKKTSGAHQYRNLGIIRNPSPLVFSDHYWLNLQPYHLCYPRYNRIYKTYNLGILRLIA